MDKTKKPNILVTNDDGIDSAGIATLAKALKKIGNVTVVAPASQQSATGHSLTIENPLRYKKVYRDGEFFGYAVYGKPADCVKMAVCSLLDEKPDLVVSGVNHGTNTSINILYSGTVAGAIEGMIYGIQSLAVSLADFRPGADSATAAKYACEIAARLIKSPLRLGTVLNVNVPALPAEEIKGIRATKLCNSVWNDRYEPRQDPFGREYFWFAGDYEIIDEDPTADDVALRDGYVSVTPIKFDFFDSASFDGVKKLENIKLK